jgi:chromate transporter
MVLSWIYAAFGNVGFVAALFFGLKAAVLAIVLAGGGAVGKPRAEEPHHDGARGAAFVGDLLLRTCPFRLIVLAPA